MFTPLAFFVPPYLITEEVVEGVSAAAEEIAPHAAQIDILDLIMGSGPVVQGVLVLLAFMSVMTWGIVYVKWRQVRSAKRQTKKFSDIFMSSTSLRQIDDASKHYSASPAASVYAAGFRELREVMRSEQQQDSQMGGAIENIDRALKKAKAEQINYLEQGVTFLATTASAAPFIGLFGTVWGIMNAFIGLSSAKSSSIQAVAPGISEALIATALGLAAAIPAAIAYNYFMRDLRSLARDMDIYSAEFLNIARRHFVR